MKTVILLLSIQVLLGAVTHRIGIVDNEFAPQDVYVAPGDTVWWINQGASPHTATSGKLGVPDSIWDSGAIAPGDSFAFVFDLPLNGYDYYCALNWQAGMSGIIILGAGIEQREGVDLSSDETVIPSDPLSPFTQKSTDTEKSEDER